MNKQPSRSPTFANEITMMNGEINYISSSYGTARNNASTQLGCLNGVFLPCLSNILGVILFLRLPSITAQAGCMYTTGIILICVTSTLITSISLSAIVTNGKICGGGAYYVISRTLGLEIGGALGLLYYLGTTMACAMSILGAVEVMTTHSTSLSQEELDEVYNAEPMMQEQIHESIVADGNHSSFPLHTQLLSLCLVFILASVVTIGVRVVNMASNLFLALVFLSIFCSLVGCILCSMNLFLGELTPFDRMPFDNLWPHYDVDPATGVVPDFESLVSLFYPSVTGILTALGRSHLLADPQSSIPRGTISAISFSTTIYLLVVWIFGLTISNATLKANKFILADIAFPQSQVVFVAVAVSCIGCSLQYMASAPRLLAAIANDNTMPILNFINDDKSDSPYTHNSGEASSSSSSVGDSEGSDGVEEKEFPKRALYLTLLIVSCASLTGNLDRISPFATMFFLLMYAGINCSCFLLGFIQSPGFRPTFKYYHWIISLFGFVWCIGLALSIDFTTATLSIFMFVAIALYNRKKMTRRKDWGGVFDSVKYDVVKQSLRALSHTTTSDMNAKNWRPQLLTFVDMDSLGEPKNIHVLHLASQLKKGHGINIVVGVLSIEGSESSNGIDVHASSRVGMDSKAVCETLSNSKRLLHEQIMVEKMDGFVQVSGSGMRDAVWSSLLHSGIGPLSPNTVLLTYPTEEQRSSEQWKEDEYMTTIKGITNMKVALLLFRGTESYQSTALMAEIHVWWIVHDGGLLLLLPYILAKNGNNRTRLRIFAVTTSSTENPDKLKRAVERHLQEVRIVASLTIIDLSNTTIADDMRDTSMSLTSMEPLFAETNTHDKTVSEAFSHETYEIPYSALDVEMGTQSEDEIGLDDNIEQDDDDRRLKNAATFNHYLRLHSSNANLVVANLPLIHKYDASSLIFKYIDVMCDGLDNVLMIRGSGKEVITTYV